MRGTALLLAALCLAGCDDPAPPARQGAAPAPPAPAPPAAAEGRAGETLQAAEDRLRARLRSEGPLTQRAVVVHRQALAGTLAVCGQVNPTGRREDPFIPYVALVAFEGDRANALEFHLAASSPEATRVYLEMVERCFDGGGPAGARSAGRALPPVPSGLPRDLPRDLPGEPPRPLPAAQAPLPIALPAPPQPAAPSPAAPSPADAAAAGPAQGLVTTSTRTPVNVRATPSGGGEVLRVVPRGSGLQVFGEAPGGWLQVGEGEPWGWLHRSMLEGR